MMMALEDDEVKLTYEKELICPVCEDFYTTPIVLPCQHSICYGCAKQLVRVKNPTPASSPPKSPTRSVSVSVDEEGGSSSRSSSISEEPSELVSTKPRNVLIQKRRFSLDTPLKQVGGPPRRKPSIEGSNSPRNMLAQRRVSLSNVSNPLGLFDGIEGDATIHCPVCDLDLPLGQKGLNGLFRNFTLEYIVERFKRALKKSNSILCGRCKFRPRLEATKSCLDCQESFCNECFKDNHKWGTLRASHMYTGATNNFRPKIITCVDHPEEQVTMYCVTCQRSICRLCKLAGSDHARSGHSGIDHTRHKINNMSTTFKLFKDELLKELKLFNNKVELIKGQIESLEKGKQKIQKGSRSIEDEVEEKIRQLMVVLQKRKDIMLEQLEEEEEQKIGDTDSQLKICNQLLENAGLVDLAAEVLKEPDQACFVHAAKALTERISNASVSTRPLKIDVDDKYNYVVDVTKENNLLNKLDFLQVPDAPTVDTSKCHEAPNYILVQWKEAEGPESNSYTIQWRKCTPNGLDDSGINGNTDEEEEDETATWNTSTNITDRFHVINELSSSSAYRLRVKASNARGEGEYGDVVTIYTTASPGLHTSENRKTNGMFVQDLEVNGNRQATDEELIGEIAFQLDRRIVGCVFGDQLPERERKRGRFYGYSVLNSPEMIERDSFKEDEREEMRQRYSGVYSKLKPLGFDIHLHPIFIIKTINKHGMLSDIGKCSSQRYKKSELQNALLRARMPKKERETTKCLLDCLVYLASEDNRPLFLY